MKEVNITKHALMRYASRVYKYQIINDRTLKEKQVKIEARQNEIAGEQVELRNIIKVAEEKIVRSKLAL